MFYVRDKRLSVVTFLYFDINVQHHKLFRFSQYQHLPILDSRGFQLPAVIQNPARVIHPNQSSGKKTLQYFYFNYISILNSASCVISCTPVYIQEIPNTKIIITTVDLPIWLETCGRCDLGCDMKHIYNTIESVSKIIQSSKENETSAGSRTAIRFNQHPNTK